MSLKEFILKKDNLSFLLVSLLMLGLIMFAGITSPTGYVPFNILSEDVHISPQSPYTTDSLLCSWDFAGSNISVVWRRNGVIQTDLNNETSVLGSLTTKGDVWVCEVDDLDSVDGGSASVTVANSAPSVPDVFMGVSSVSDGFELVEDSVYVFTFNASDADGDELIYSFAPPAPDFCVLDQQYGQGEVTCEVLHEHVSASGTDEFGIEEVKNIVVGFQATERFGTEKLASIRELNLTLMPVNNQAEFLEVINDTSLNALSPWEFLLEGVDEELNLPLNFTIASDDDLGLIFTNITSSSATLTFEHNMPTNSHVGNWTVIINLTDDGSSNLSAASFSFDLQINRTNELPYFISDFSSISGTQNQPFFLEIEARDDDDNDTLSFNILKNSSANSHCVNETFTWNISTINNTAEGGLAHIDVPMLNNDHVICRDVLLEVRDQTDSSEVVSVLFNITNVNDAPTIHELSFFENNSFAQTNMSNLTIGLHSTDAIYKINATDPDALTYDKNNTGILSFSVNNSNFSIDEDTGILSLDFSDVNMLGVHYVLVTVTDNALTPLSDSRVLSINIVENTPPILSVPVNYSFNQNDDIIVEFNITDIDGDLVEVYLESNDLNFNNSIYDISLNLSSYNISSPPQNISSWQFNLSRWVEQKYLSASLPRPTRELYRNELVGRHNVSISVFDERGAHSAITSQENLVFDVLNDNDAPFFDMVVRDNVSDGFNITFRPMVAGRVFARTFYATDFDLFLPNDIYDEDLTFVLHEWSDLSGQSFTKLSDDSAVLEFVPNSMGSEYVVVGVYDRDGAGENITVDFVVYDETAPPEFVSVSPHLEGNMTVFDFKNTSEISLPLMVHGVENESITFDADISFVEEIFGEGGVVVNNSLDVEWFLNGESVAYLSDVVPTINSSYDFFFDFFSAGLNNITMRAIDAVESFSDWTWVVDVENVNRPPIFCNSSLEDLRFSGSTSRDYYLGYLSYQRFYDPDDDPVNDGLSVIDPCNVSRSFNLISDLRSLNSLEFGNDFTTVACNADFIYEGTNLTIVGYAQGICRVVFYAVDDYGEVAFSDEVEIEILEAIETEEVIREKEITVTEQITVPIEERVDVPVPVKVIFPGDVVFYQNKSVEVPLVIVNNWSEDFRGVVLSAYALNSSSEVLENEDLSVSLSQSVFNELPEGMSRNVSLIISNYRAQGPLLINVYAEIEEPDFVDSDTIVIAGLEMAGDSPQSVRALVTYARDLLSSSPQCAELNDLLDNAARVLEQGLAEDALRLIDAAINGCQYLLSQEEISRRENPGALRAGLTFTSEYWSEIILGSIALIFIAIVFYVFAFIRLSLKNK
ncbi:MAG: hypothetical protein ACLFN8_02240 [Candidatus Woesearchaeota archaeon]